MNSKPQRYLNGASEVIFIYIGYIIFKIGLFIDFQFLQYLQNGLK